MHRRDFEWFAEFVVRNKIDLDKQAMHELTEYFELRNPNFDYKRFNKRLEQIHEEKRMASYDLLEFVRTGKHSTS